MSISFFNTLSRRKEEFVPLEEGRVRVYTCGPTVYDYAHIGNFRAFIFEDLLRRYLKYHGYQVYQVMNITDVDDKTIAGAKREGVSLKEFTQRYTDAFFEDLETLNIERAEVYPLATEHIGDMVALVKRLIKNGLAYEVKGAFYFRISQFKDYGKLSHMKLNGLRIGTRVSSDEYEKDEASDFALWKAWEPEDGDVFWETDLGKGRPGWHIECSSMSMKYLGEHFDIHTGGVDTIFPHHENEIAQSEGATGAKFVNYWLHCDHLIVEGRKMSKSLGNYYTLRDILAKGYNPRAIRHLLLSTHYRQKLNFTFDGLKASQEAVERLDDLVANLKRLTGEGGTGEVERLVSRAKKEFSQALDDDLNISGGWGALFKLVRKSNRLILQGKMGRREGEMVLEAVKDFDRVLGVIKEKEEEIGEEELELIKRREEARKEGNWELADRIREELLRKGISLEDRLEGTSYKVRRK